MADIFRNDAITQMIHQFDWEINAEFEFLMCFALHGLIWIFKNR